MSSHNVQAEYYNALGAQGAAVIQDPGDAGEIDSGQKGFAICKLTTTTSETRTLADPDRAGQRLLLEMITDGGDCVVTADTAIDEAGNTTLTFSDAGQMAELIGVDVSTSALAWRVVGNDGVAGPEVASASNVSFADGGGFTSADNVDSALDEIYQHLISVNAVVPINLVTFREVDGNRDVGDSDANGGVLASNTTPVLRGGSTDALELFWAAANTDSVAVSITLPNDIDDTADAYVDLAVTANTTDQAPTFTVETNWDGAAEVSDTATAVTATTRQEITATIASGDVPSGPFDLTIGLTPAAHATSTFQLHGVRFRYKRKLLTA